MTRPIKAETNQTKSIQSMRCGRCGRRSSSKTLFRASVPKFKEKLGTAVDHLRLGPDKDCNFAENLLRYLNCDN